MLSGEITEQNAVMCEAQNGSLTHQPKTPPRRKSSFSEALNKIATNPFARRRTATLLPSSSSPSFTGQQSRLPTPSGIPIPKSSSSGFSNFNAFASKSTTASTSSDAINTKTPKRGRKVSDRLARTPFLSNQSESVDTTPVTNKQHKREPSIQIETRGLMAPLHPPLPSLPRSSTMGNITQGADTQSSPQTPSFMRSTSSSAARRGTIANPKPQLNTPMSAIPTSKTPSIQRSTRLSGSNSFNATSRAPTRQYSNTRAPSVAPNTALQPSGQHPPRKSSLVHAQSKSSINLDTNNVTRQRSATLIATADNRQTTHGRARSSLPRLSASSVERIIADKEVPHVKEPAAHSGYYKRGNSFARRDSEHHLASHAEHAEPAENDRDQTPTPEPSDPRLIHTALPNLQWAGRFQAVSDRFRTAVLPSSSPDTRSGASSSASSNTDPMHDPMHDEIRRMPRVYKYLESLCTTQEALQSLADFREFMLQRDERMNGGVKGEKVREKQGWLQGLMGKKKGEGSNK